MDGEGDGSKNRKSHGISSNASNYNISKRQGNVNSIQKEAISQSGVASFVSKEGGIKTIPHITEKDGMRIIGANKNIDENAFVEGFWDDIRKNY